MHLKSLVGEKSQTQILIKKYNKKKNFVCMCVYIYVRICVFVSFYMWFPLLFMVVWANHLTVYLACVYKHEYFV